VYNTPKPEGGRKGGGAIQNRRKWRDKETGVTCPLACTEQRHSPLDPLLRAIREALAMSSARAIHTKPGNASCPDASGMRLTPMVIQAVPTRPRPSPIAVPCRSPAFHDQPRKARAGTSHHAPPTTAAWTARPTPSVPRYGLWVKRSDRPRRVAAGVIRGACLIARHPCEGARREAVSSRR